MYQCYAQFYLGIAHKWKFIVLAIVFYWGHIYKVFCCVSLVFHQYAMYIHYISYGLAICYQGKDIYIHVFNLTQRR